MPLRCSLFPWSLPWPRASCASDQATLTRCPRTAQVDFRPSTLLTTARVLRLMAGLKATGWLPPAFAPPVPLPPSYISTHTTRSARLPAAGSSSLAGGLPAAQSRSHASRDGSSGGFTGTASAMAAFSRESASSAMTQAARTAHASREDRGTPPAGAAQSAGPQQQQQQQKSRPQATANRKSPAEARAEAFKTAVPEVFFLKGVSFDERQQNIEAIDKGACDFVHVCHLPWRALCRPSASNTMRIEHVP